MLASGFGRQYLTQLGTIDNNGVFGVLGHCAFGVWRLQFCSSDSLVGLKIKRQLQLPCLISKHLAVPRQTFYKKNKTHRRHKPFPISRH